MNSLFRKLYTRAGMTAALGLILMAATAHPAHAISRAYRAQLERSGCTQQTDGNGCDVTQSRAWNERHMTGQRAAPLKRALTRLDTRKLVGKPIDEVAEQLLDQQWKPDNGKWQREGQTLVLEVKDNIVTRARLN